MEISLLNVKVTFQKNSVVADDIGNRRNVWEDYYTCHATVSGESGNEKAAAGLTVVDSDIAFTIRFCKRAAEVTADGFRILFGGESYNIVAVDRMNYRKKALKFRCEKAGR
ncbi:phage head closure protein [Mediterraneibacter glycyrrhizinilyticus]|nr:phage head closure protein [Mediterraneibacter glycyrrhizinilyticus]MBM6854129.1 phage head closure protein [Mediterraneibacter glycyrrhizinilyticus]